MQVSKFSVLSGNSYGIAKIGQKALKDIALIESNLFPESAFGSQLDLIGERLGIGARFTESESSTYIRLVADPGTTYLKNTHTFSSKEGITFILDKDVIIPTYGFTYVKVRAQDKGLLSNVSAFSINKINTTLTGHKYVINEFAAQGGRDAESDDLYLKRIKEGSNVLAQTTLGMLEQIFMKINPNVLRVIYEGVNGVGKFILSIITQNGIELSGTELEELRIKSEAYLSLNELKSFDEDYTAIQLKNVTWYPIDISFRVLLSSAFTAQDVIKDIQIKLNKYVDYRFWGQRNPLDKIYRRRNIVEWDKILSIISETRGVDYIADEYFYPNVDITLPKNTLPRLRGFLMLDLNGNIILDLNGELNPFYYPNNPDFKYHSTVLRSIE